MSQPVDLDSHPTFDPAFSTMFANTAPRFCQQCGAGSIEFVVPHGDDRNRHVCGACGHIHYLNPKLVVGTLPVWENKVLLCKRAIEPRYGKWTLPAGFMEEGETIEDGALRETLEEAGARVAIDEVYVTLSLPQISQVYMLFRARLLDLDFKAGTESLEVRLFEEHEIPWDEIAFRTITAALKQFFADRALGTFKSTMGSLTHPAK
jgi:ADP-ribose pyrophosphatase YjhB (NUDIX family)